MENKVAFQYYRFLVCQMNEQLSLLMQGKTKKDILIETFENDYKFDYWGSTLSYKFIRREGDFIFSYFGKKSAIKKNLPPEEAHIEVLEDHWPKCNMLINLSDNSETGQFIAFECKKKIFDNPLTPLRAFSDKCNEKLKLYNYSMAINPVETQHDFWDLVNKHQGKIREITFYYTAPNLFNLRNELEDELKDARDICNATSTALTLKNETTNLTIPTDNPMINQSVNYISRGGGEFKIKDTNNKIYISANKIKTKDVEIDGLSVEMDAASFKAIVKKVFNVINTNVS